MSIVKSFAKAMEIPYTVRHDGDNFTLSTAIFQLTEWQVSLRR